MKSVFILWHTYDSRDQDENSKMIGVYASRDDAEEAKHRMQTQPGFTDYPDGFIIDQYEVGKDHWTEGFVSVQNAEKRKGPTSPTQTSDSADFSVRSLFHSFPSCARV